MLTKGIRGAKSFDEYVKGKGGTKRIVKTEAADSVDDSNIVEFLNCQKVWKISETISKGGVSLHATFCVNAFHMQAQ